MAVTDGLVSVNDYQIQHFIVFTSNRFKYMNPKNVNKVEFWLKLETILMVSCRILTATLPHLCVSQFEFKLREMIQNTDTKVM